MARGGQGLLRGFGVSLPSVRSTLAKHNKGCASAITSENNPLRVAQKDGFNVYQIVVLQERPVRVYRLTDQDWKAR